MTGLTRLGEDMNHWRRAGHTSKCVNGIGDWLDIG